MKLEHKVVPVVETKVIDEEQGIVGAYVSVTGVVDSVKDRIIPGAYQKTLVARTPKGVWSHDWDKPVSKTLSAEELLPGDDRLPAKTRDGADWPATAGALYVETQFNLDTQRGREAFSDVKFYGPDQEWSIGYNVPPGAARMDGKTGVRELSYIDLYEYSPVLFGAMSLTATAGVKDAQEAWKAKVEAGEATPDMVVEEDEEERTKADVSMGDVVIVPAGTLHSEASRMLAEAMAAKTEGEVLPTDGDPAVDAPGVPVATGFTAVTEDTPVTTPADPIHQATPGHTGDQAGVDVEPRPAADANPAVEDPKAAAVSAFVDSLPEEVKAKVTEWMATREPGEAKASVTLTGSYEERQQALRRQAGTITDGFDLDGTDDWGYPRYYLGVEATFNNRVVYASYDMEGDDPPRFFEASYSFDGQQATLKNPREVRLEAAVVAKCAAKQAKLVKAMREFREADDQEKATTFLKVARGDGESLYATVEVASRGWKSVDVPAMRAAVEQALEPFVPAATKPEAKTADADPPEGESTTVILTEADLLLLERLKLDA